jgi:hypothetical protein
MFLGIFVTKPQRDEKRSTIISLSVNVNTQATKFAGIYGFAERGTDFLNELSGLFYDVLSLFCKVIFVISDSFDHFVLEHWIPAWQSSDYAIWVDRQFV